MSYSSNQIQDFIPNDNFKESEITQDKSLGSKANQIFDKQKKLREALVELIRTCYNDIHQTADNRQKSIIRFNDRYLIPTILGSLKNIDQEQVQRTIEDIILENFVDIKTFDQVKLKKQVLDILKQNHSEKEDKTQEIDNTKTEIGSVSVNIDAKNTLDLFNQMLGNETLMNSIVEKVGGRIIECGNQSSSEIIKQTDKIGQQKTSEIKSDTTKSNTKIQTPKSMSRSRKRRERQIKRNQKVQSRISGLNGIIMGQIESINDALTSNITGFKVKKQGKYGFIRIGIRNTKAFFKKKEQKIKNIGRKVGLFKVKQRTHSQHSREMQFLKNYNNILYKGLISRIGEFDKAIILGKVQKKKIIKKFGLGVWSAVKWMVGKVWGLIKGVASTLWNLSKKIFSLVKIGLFATINQLKYLLFTPEGMYMTGFVVGIVYHTVIKPVIDFFKKIFDDVVKALGFKDFDHLKKESEGTLAELRTKYIKLLRDNNMGVRKIDRLLFDMEYLNSKLSNFQAKGMNMGGKVINTPCSTVGVIVGSFFGPVGAIIGGALGKAIGMTAEYFYKQIPDSVEDETQKNLILRNIRKRYKVTENSKPNSMSTRTKIAKSANDEKIKNSRKKISELEKKLKDPNTSEEEKTKIKSEIASEKISLEGSENYSEFLQRLQDSQDEDESSEEYDIIKKMYDYVKSDTNYFDSTNNINALYQDIKEDRKPKGIQNDNKKDMIISEIKRHVFLEAFNQMVQGKIIPRQFVQVVNGNIARIRTQKDLKLKYGFWDFKMNDNLNDYISKSSEFKADNSDRESIRNALNNGLKEFDDTMSTGGAELDKILEKVRVSLGNITVDGKKLTNEQIEEIMSMLDFRSILMSNVEVSEGDWRIRGNEKLVITNINAFARKIAEVKFSSEYDQKEQKDEYNEVVKHRVGIVQKSMELMGNALGIDDKEINVAFGKAYIDEDENQKKIKEDDKKAIEELEVIRQQKRKDLNDCLKELEEIKMKERLRGVQIFLPNQEKETEKNANAENDGSNIVFGEWRGMTGINPMNLNFKSGK